MKTNLFIVGTIKAATTSIYNYLNASSDIYFPPIKELHFFSDVRSLIDENSEFNPNKKQHSRVINTLQEYNQLYPFNEEYIFFGDCSPTYLSDKNAPIRIFEYNPNAKIVVIIRNPVERLISHYLMNVNRNVENDNFIDAIKKDYLKVNQQLFIDNKYVELGMYGEQIARYLEHFDRKNIFIFKFEDLKKDTGFEINRLLKQLELEPLNNEVFDKKYNTYGKPIFPFINYLRKNEIIKKIVGPKLKFYAKKIFFSDKKEKFNLSKDETLFIENLYKDDQQVMETLIGFKYF